MSFAAGFDFASILSFLAVCALIALGSFVQGCVGLGMGLVAAPFVYMIAPEMVPSALLVPMFFASVLLLARERQAVVWRDAGVALLARAPGVLIATATLTALTPAQFAATFAALLTLAAALSLAGLRIARTPRSMACAGFASGFMGTLTSVGGPPMAIVMQNGQGPDVRATASAFFAAGTLMSIVSLAWADAFTLRHAGFGALLIPPMLLGVTLSRRSLRWVDGGALRGALIGLVIFAAAMLLLRALA